MQYELERTLPSLQLCDERGIFSKDQEIRQISHRRSQFEQTLVRRHVRPDDFVRYFEYENKLDQLLHLRIAKADLSPKESAQLRRDSSAHIVSIFERGVKKCRYDVDLWQRYIKWASAKGMRVVVGRITARAIALHPTKMELWLSAANYELNVNHNVAGARALLQRALRASAIPHHPVRAEAPIAPPPAKRLKGKGKGKGKAKTVSDESEENDLEGERATLKLSDKEKELVHLWIEYVRMELVFLERVRRRRFVLGNKDDDNDALREAQRLEEAVSTSKPAAEEDEDVAKGVPESDEGVESGPQEGEDAQVTEAPKDSLSVFGGAIVAMILKSATDINSPSSLPPQTHFGFILAFIKLIRSFPFYKGQKVASSLLERAYDTLQARYPSDAAVMAFIAGRFVVEGDMSIDEDLESKIFKKRSRLCDPSSGPTKDCFAESTEAIADWKRYDRDREDGEALNRERVMAYVLSNVARGLSIPSLRAPGSDGRVAPQRISDAIDALSTLNNSEKVPQSAHYAAQLLLIAKLHRTIRGKKLEELENYLLAAFNKCFKAAEKAKKADADVMAAYLSNEFLRLQEEYKESEAFFDRKRREKAIKGLTALYKRAATAIETFETVDTLGNYNDALLDILLSRIQANMLVAEAVSAVPEGEVGTWVIVRKAPEEIDLENAWAGYLEGDRTGDEFFNNLLWEKWCYYHTKDPVGSSGGYYRSYSPEARKDLAKAMKTTMNMPMHHHSVLLYFFWCLVVHKPVDLLYPFNGGLYMSTGDEENISGRERAANGGRALKALKHIVEKANATVDFYRWAIKVTLNELRRPVVPSDAVGAGQDADRITKGTLNKVVEVLFERVESLTRNADSATLDEHHVDDVKQKLIYFAVIKKDVAEATKVFSGALAKFSSANKPELRASLEQQWKRITDMLAKGDDDEEEGEEEEEEGEEEEEEGDEDENENEKEDEDGDEEEDIDEDKENQIIAGHDFDEVASDSGSDAAEGEK